MALFGVHDDEYGFILDFLCLFDHIGYLIEVMAVDLEDLQAEACIAGLQVMLGNDVRYIAVKLLTVVVKEDHQVVQLPCPCGFQCLIDLTLLSLTVTDDAEGPGIELL